MFPDLKLVNTLQSGDYFGEISIIKNLSRNATIFTSCESHFLTLGRNAFKKYFLRHF